MKISEVVGFALVVLLISACDDVDTSAYSDAATDGAGGRAVDASADGKSGLDGLGGPDGNTVGQGDAGISAVTFSTEVTGSKRIADLSPSERAQLCGDMDDWASSWFRTGLKESLCKVAGFREAEAADVMKQSELRMACQQRILQLSSEASL